LIAGGKGGIKWRMKIAIMGSGGVGGYFGARLAAAGEDVTFIARGAHLEAIRGGGLKVASERGDLHIVDAKATDDPAEVGPVDIVLFAVKLWDTENAATAIRPLIGAETAAISLQNGVDAESAMAAVLGPGHVMGGVAKIAAVIAAPGVIRHTGTMAEIVFGELDGRRSPRGERFRAALEGAGVDAVLSDDITKAIWEKLVILAALSGATAVTRRPIGPIRDDPDTWSFFTRLAEETAAVGRAAGIALDDGLAERMVAFAAGLPAEMTSSMAQDLERGNRLELPWLSGAVARMGRERGVATPAHDFVRTALKLHEMGRDATES
jgi:2-dehydropantoate 2-reductase